MHRQLQHRNVRSQEAQSARVFYAGRAPEFVGLLLDLNCKLAGGRKHKHAGALARIWAHVGYVHKARQQEAAGLATASLSYGDQIPAL